MSIRVIRPGLLSSVQDLGRYGMQKHGVIVSGAMDPVALRIANILVGNEEGEAAIEMTMIGPKLQFEEDAMIAICGGDLSPAVDGQAIPGWRPIFIKKGSILSFGAVKTGCRAYLALAGGFDLPQVMDSRSTYLRAGIGGYMGRAFQNGDVIQQGTPSETATRRMERLSEKAGSKAVAFSEWSVGNDILLAYQEKTVIRIMQGGQYDWFTEASQKQFFQEEFLITPQSDRMGYRISGPKLELSEPRELISEAVTAGTVQVPSDGNPIVLMADRQTTGGYPKIAQVASVDLPVLAQVKPGERIRFKEIRLEEAQALLLSREIEIQLLKQGVSLKD